MHDEETYLLNAKSSAEHRWITYASVFFICIGLFGISRYNYLLFHTITEFFSILVACGIFVVAWNSRHFIHNNYFLLLGVAYLFISVIDLVHTLAYKGMGIFPNHGSDLSTQLWIAARYMEAGSLCFAPIYLKKELKVEFVIGVYFFLTALIFLSIFLFDIFPVCFVEGQGLTPFKRISEYIISAILIVAIVFLYRMRTELDDYVFSLIVGSIIVTIFAEMAFTFYVSVYGLSNLIGHLLKTVSFILIYKAIIETGFKRPYDLLLRNLKKSEQQLMEHRNHLEMLVEKRTHDLRIANENLQQDLIKRKKLEAQLRQVYKMESIGTLAGGIAHDFNNILASVMGYTELAMAKVEADPTIHQDLSQVLAAGNRARDLVQQILTFSRQDEKEPRPVLIKPLVGEVLKLIQSALPFSIKIELNLKGEPLIMADSTQIFQVLMNLCANAGHAMQANGGTLLVELESVEIGNEFSNTIQQIQPGPYVLLAVTDTGCGMTKDVKERIFDPFYTTKERGKGTGMGLSVVHGIVTGLGGTITVYSEPGKGSSFKLLFPAVERRNKSEEREAKPLPGGGEHILLVDDDVSVCQLNKDIFQSLGYKLTTCASGAEALDVFEDKIESFDLVIADLTMPNMTGLQLAQTLIGIKSDIPIILCSGFSPVLYEHYAKQIGVRACLSKPVLIRELSETIRKVMDAHPVQ